MNSFFERVALALAEHLRTTSDRIEGLIERRRRKAHIPSLAELQYRQAFIDQFDNNARRLRQEIFDAGAVVTQSSSASSVE